MNLLKAFLPGLGVALAVLIFAWMLGLVRFGAPPPPGLATPQPEGAPVVTGSDRRLESELHEAKKRIELLEWELEQEKKLTAAAKPPASPPEPGGSALPEDLEIPEDVLAAGKVVGVSEEALRAAYRLDMAARGNKSAPGALEALLAQGADGFRAVVALMRSGLRATWQRDWLAKTYRPGLEQVLIDFVEDPQHKDDSAIALSFLAVADTRRVRDYLVQKVQDDPRPFVVYSAAQALGSLKEPRGANAIGLSFAQPEWGGVRGSILHDLGEMGGADARRILIDYLRMDSADNLAAAINALDKIDKDVAKREATRILSREGAEFIHFLDRDELKKVAEQE